LAFVLVAMLSPSAAHGQTVQVPLVRGFVTWQGAVYSNGIVFGTFTPFNASPGTRVELRCTPPAGRSCPIRARAVLPPAGFAYLARYTRGHRVPIGAVLRITFINSAGSSKVLAYTVRRSGLPTLKRTCFDAQGTEVSCLVDCQSGAAVPPGDVCEGAGKTVQIAANHYDYYVRWGARGPRTWFTRLRMTRLSAGTTVEVTCIGFGCPFGMRVFVPRQGSVDVARALRGARLSPGAIVSVVVARASERAAVVLFHMRYRREPRVVERCRDPSQIAPGYVRC
jgi:hypothetical protein